MSGRTKHRLIWLLTAVFFVASATTAMQSAFAGSTPFSQGAGYELGLYDRSAPQPTAFNWTRQSPYAAATDVPSAKWAFKTGDRVRSSPAIAADGTIYVGSDDYNVYAIRPNGSLKWAFPTEKPVYSSPAIGVDGTIYVGSDDRKLYALSAKDGSEIWSFSTNGPIQSSPAIGADGTVYIGADNECTLYAVNPDGTEKWHYRFLGGWPCLQSSPVVGQDGRVYVGWFHGPGPILAFAAEPDDPEYVEPLWRFDTNRSIKATPVIGDDGTLYAGSDDGFLYAINAADGQLKWSFETTSPVKASPVIAEDGTIYVVDTAGVVYALDRDQDPADVQPKWSYDIGAVVYGTPIIGADGTLYFGSHDTNVYAISADGTAVWQFATESAVTSSPAIDPNGVLYVGSWDGHLYALNCAGAACPRSPAPKPRPPYTPPPPPPVATPAEPPALPPFVDTVGHWAEDLIQQARVRLQLNGYPDGTFRPDAPMSRAEMVVLLVNALQLPPTANDVSFADDGDIPDWARDAVAAAYARGYIAGTADGNMRPHEPLTRSELAVIVARVLDLPPDGTMPPGFSDDEDIPDWARGAIRAVHEAAVMTGRDDGTFDPHAHATRAEVVAVVVRVLALIDARETGA